MLRGRAHATLSRVRALCSSNGGGGGGGTPPNGGGNPLGAVSSADDISTLKLYRDCMRLSYHIAAASAKGNAMREMIRANFRSHMHVEDPKEIRRLKMLAVVGLQNYVIHEQTGKALEKRKRERGDRGDGGDDPGTGGQRGG